MAFDYDVTTAIDYHDDQFNSLVTTTLDKTRSSLTDQILRKQKILAWLNSKSRVTVDGGLTIRRPLIYDYNSTIGSYSMYDLIDTTPQDGLGFAQYEWFSFAGSITIAGEEVDKNSGSAAIINLLSTKVLQLNYSFERWLNKVLWGTQTNVNGALDMISLPEIISVNDPGGATNGPVRGASYSLGGIPSATTNSENVAYWIAQETASLDLSVLDGTKTLANILNNLSVVGSKPDLVVTTQAVSEQYEFLTLDNTLRYTSTKMADLGFDSIAFKGAELVWEDELALNAAVNNQGIQGSDYTSQNPLFFINSDHLEFVQHSNTWMRRTEFQRPFNQDAKTALVLSRGQLITDCRRAHGVVLNVVV